MFVLDFHGIPVISYIYEWIHTMLLKFKGMDMSIVLGGASISFWQILVSLFVAGTIINMLTGIDGDPSEDE